MTKQQKDTDHGVRPFGLEDSTLDTSAGLDQRAHPKAPRRARILEQAGQVLGPFSAENVAKGGTRDDRARPHGESDGLSLQRSANVQPLAVGDFPSQKADVDRIAFPDHSQSEK
jgi:hypothetical protein